MTLTDRHLDELKRHFWSKLPSGVARYSTLFLKSHERGVEAAALALRFRDRHAIAAIGQAALERGLLDLKALRRLRLPAAMLYVLIEEGRYEAALQLLDILCGDNAEPSAKLSMQRARILAGLGRLEEAHQSVSVALALEPGSPHGGELPRLLETLRTLGPPVARGEAGWPELRRLAEAYLGLDLPDHARQLVSEATPRLAAPAPADYDDALEVLKTALQLLGPEFVLPQTIALRPVARDDRLKALVAETYLAGRRVDKASGPDEGGRDLRLQRALACAAAGDADEAIRRLGSLSQKLREDLEVRAALAFHVGAHVLAEAPLELRPAAGPRRIFNLMPFNDEIAILKMHLAEMADWVDLFVIVESEVTFTGLPKPLHFQAHRHEFAQYADKIRHVVVPAHPPAFDSPWARDFRQRDMAITAISGLAAPEDLVLLTDVDEIVDRHAFEGFNGQFAGLSMATFRFFLNYRPDPSHRPVRRTGAVWKAKFLQRFGSSYARFHLARRGGGPQIDDAGWHFTSVCDPARLVAKVNSYAHQERAVEWRDVEAVDRRLSAIRSGAFEPGWERADIEKALPAYVREHLGELDDLLI